MKSLKQLSFLKLVRNMSSCKFDFSGPKPDELPVLISALEEFGLDNQSDIHTVIRADVSSLQTIGDKAQIRKHLLIVCDENNIYYYWFQIHSEYVAGPPQRYSPYSRVTPVFKWVLNVVEATNENCDTPIFKNHVSRPQTRIPTYVRDILDSGCPQPFRMACNNAKHFVMRHGS